MDRQLPDFLDTLEWNLVARVGLQVEMIDGRSYRPIPPQTFYIENSHVVIVGVKSATTQSNWYTGGWASQVIPFLPSSTTSFVAATQHEQKRLRLGLLNLLVFPKVTDSWLLQVATPPWFTSTFIEIWRYDGRDFSAQDRADRIDQTLIEIQSRLPPTN